jgi:hypothetical protein
MNKEEIIIALRGLREKGLIYVSLNEKGEEIYKVNKCYSGEAEFELLKPIRALCPVFQRCLQKSVKNCKVCLRYG